MGLDLQTRTAASLKMAHRLAPAMRLGVELLSLPINDLKAAVKKEVDENPAVEASFPLVLPRLVGLTGDNGFLIDNARAKGTSLAEHLLSELRMGGVEGRAFQVCAAVVSELDETGYFRGEIPSMMMTLNATAEEIETARRRIMTIDPKGCGARDLKECLLAQIGVVPPEKREAFRQGIENILEGRVSEEAKPYILKMKAAPGKAFAYVKVDYVTPDIVVDGRGDVFVDTRDIPELTVSPKYVEMAKDRELDEETRRFAEEKVARARDFREALLRRQETLENIAEIAIGNQQAFLREGPKAIHAQTMSSVAKAAKCSVATVSRAAHAKFVKTPRGVVPFKVFFALTDQAPLEKLREVLASYGAKNRPTDEVLSQMMTQAGFPMARRTVAKYRAKLGYA